MKFYYSLACLRYCNLTISDYNDVHDDDDDDDMPEARV